MSMMPCRSQSARKPLEEPGGRHDIAALALHRLDEDPCDLLRRHVVREEDVFDVVERRLPLIVPDVDRSIVVGVRHVCHAGHGREEAELLRVLAAREGERAHRATVEAPEEADEARTPGDVARELERALDRLRAGVAHEAEHGFVAHRLQLGDALGEPHLLLVPVVAGDVEEALRRLGDRSHDLRVRMPRGADGDAGGEVEESVAVDVPHLGALAVRHREGIVARVARRDHGRVTRDEGLGLGAGEFGLDMRGSHAGRPGERLDLGGKVARPAALHQQSRGAEAGAGSPAQGMRARSSGPLCWRRTA
jgi:hypothetical protein